MWRQSNTPGMEKSVDILNVKGLNAGYTSDTVLKGVDLHVGQGECVAVLGANGAGKTTLLRAISGMVRRSGMIQFGGKDIVPLSPSAVARSGISHVPEGRGTLKALTVEENLRVGAVANTDRTARQADMERCFDLFPVLRSRRNAEATSLSGGEQQMLAVARALMARPRLIMLDEPSFGLAPKIVQAVYDVIGTIVRETGISVLVVEQTVELALALASRAYVLRLGKIVLEEDAQSIRSNSNLRDLYIG